MLAGKLRLIGSCLLFLSAAIVVPVVHGTAVSTGDQVLSRETAPHGGIATEAGVLDFSILRIPDNS